MQVTPSAGEILWSLIWLKDTSYQELLTEVLHPTRQSLRGSGTRRFENEVELSGTLLAPCTAGPIALTVRTREGSEPRMHFQLTHSADSTTESQIKLGCFSQGHTSADSPGCARG